MARKTSIVLHGRLRWLACRRREYPGPSAGTGVQEREGEREGLQATGSTSGAAKVRVWLILQNAIYGVEIHEGGQHSLSGDL